jgi:hypothetical protein
MHELIETAFVNLLMHLRQALVAPVESSTGIFFFIALSSLLLA